MLARANNSLTESTSPHSLATRVAMSIPMPGWDSNPLLVNTKRFWGNGLNGLTFDGSGLLGSGVFSGEIGDWGATEVVLGLVGAYAVYSMVFQAKQTSYRLEGAAHRRRKSKAASYKARAAALEAKSLGGWFA